MSKISVIVAVYNAEKYLRKCMDSLTAQTLKDIQIVCVDDASTDSSPQMLEAYAQRDRRIRIIRLGKNHGQAYARNQGIKIADGELITAVDADDWLAPDALEQAAKVFEAHPDTDCVLFNVKYVYEDGRSHGYSWRYATDQYPPLPDGSFEVMSGYDAFVASLDWQIHGWSVDRAELFRKYPYDDTCRFYSDDNTPHLHFLASREVRCCHGVYYYRQNAASATHYVGVGRMDWMRAADSLRRQLRMLRMPEKVMQIWEWERWKIIVGCYWFYFLHWRELSAEDCKYCIDEIRNAWLKVDMPRLKGRPIWKLGWFPFPRHWHLFRMEERLYFILRWIAGRR